MQFEFFPSRTLAVYIGKMFAVRIVAVLLMLVLILQMLDLLSESGKVMAAAGNGQSELLTYVSLRMPQLVSRFLPYSVLLATIITTTPGTVSCVVDDEAHEIWVHALDCGDPQEMAAQIKQRYEQPLLEIFE